MLVGVAVCVGLILWLAPSRRLARDRLAQPERVSQTARGVLAHRMARHGETLSELMNRLVLLDYEGVQREAQRIREEPPLSRPLTGDATELNSLLPARFFDLQDELRVRAAAVEEAARRSDSAKLIDSYSALARTCITCHQLYLGGDR